MLPRHLWKFCRLVAPLATLLCSLPAAARPSRATPSPVPPVSSRAPVQTLPQGSAGARAQAQAGEVIAGVVINEAAADARDGGKDWLEIFNAGTEPQDISGWTITDSDGTGNPNPTNRWTFPDMVLNPGQYLVQEEDAPGSFTFGLGSSDGLWLYNAEGLLIDHTIWQEGQAPAGSTWGRLSNGLGAFSTLSNVTRGEQNAAATSADVLEDYIFDGSIVRDYNISIRQDYLDTLNANAALEQYVPGYVQFEGQTYGPLGIRYSGNFDLYVCVDDTGAASCNQMPWKVNPSEYDASGRFYALRKLQFHSIRNESTLMRERLAGELFEEMGVKASRVVYVRLSVNGEFIGLYSLVEQIDGAFTRDRFSDGGEGNLYKEVWPQYDDPERYLQALETNEDENPDVSLMVQLAYELETYPLEEQRAILESRLDLPNLLNYLAVDRGINNWDGIMGWYCSEGDCRPHNYYWYEQVDHSRLTLIPWDFDFAFNTYVVTPFWIPWYKQTPFCVNHYFYYYQSPGCDELIYALSRLLWDEYTDAARVFLDGPYSEASIDAKFALYMEQIEPGLEEDPYGADLEEWHSDVEALRADISNLRTILQHEINGDAPEP